MLEEPVKLEKKHLNNKICSAVIHRKNVVILL